MSPHVEWIEAAIVAVAACALLASIWLGGHAVRTWLDARVERACEAVMAIAWGRIENEAGRTALAVMLLLIGSALALTPPPISPGPFRTAIQMALLVGAAVLLVQSVRSYYRSRHVVGVIERERAAGRMR